MGESAGSGCIAHLLAAYTDLPVAGAILQSGAPAGTLDADAAGWVADSFLAAAGASSVDDLRDAPVDALLAAQDQTVVDALAKVGMMPFHPWIDGDLLHGRAHESPLPAIPLVVGTTAHEMELFRDQVPALPPDIAVPYLAGKAANLGITDEDCVRAAFGAAGHDMVEAVADLELHVPNEQLARAPRGTRQRGVPLPVHVGGARAARVPRTRPAVHVRHLRREHVARVRRRDRGTRGCRRSTVSADARSVDVVRGGGHAGGLGQRTRGPPRGESASGEPEGFHDTVAHRTEIWLGDA